MATQIAAPREPPAAVDPESHDDGDRSEQTQFVPERDLTDDGLRRYMERKNDAIADGNDPAIADMIAFFGVRQDDFRRDPTVPEWPPADLPLDEPVFYSSAPEWPPDDLRLDEPVPALPPVKVRLVRPRVLIRRVNMRVRSRRRVRASARAPARPSDDPDLDLAVAGGRS